MTIKRNSYVYMYRFEGKPVYIGIGTNVDNITDYQRAKAVTEHKEVVEQLLTTKLEISIIANKITRNSALLLETILITQYSLDYNLVNKDISTLNPSSYCFVIAEGKLVRKRFTTEEREQQRIKAEEKLLLYNNTPERIASANRRAAKHNKKAETLDKNLALRDFKTKNGLYYVQINNLRSTITGIKQTVKGKAGLRGKEIAALELEKAGLLALQREEMPDLLKAFNKVYYNGMGGDIKSEKQQFKIS